MRDEVERELLQRNRAAIAQASMNRDRAADDDHHGREIERVKCHPRNQAPAVHHVQRKTKDVSSISEITFQFEVHPTKDEWKGNESRQNAAPHDQEMHGPT